MNKNDVIAQYKANKAKADKARLERLKTGKATKADADRAKIKKYKENLAKLKEKKVLETKEDSKVDTITAVDIDIYGDDESPFIDKKISPEKALLEKYKANRDKQKNQSEGSHDTGENESTINPTPSINDGIASKQKTINQYSTIAVENEQELTDKNTIEPSALDLNVDETNKKVQKEMQMHEHLRLHLKSQKEMGLHKKPRVFKSSPKMRGP